MEVGASTCSEVGAQSRELAVSSRERAGIPSERRVQISTEYSSPNYNARSEGAASIRGVAIHTTEGAWPSDLDWLCSESSGVSCHYVISPDGEPFSIVAESARAWHFGVGTWNGESDLNDVTIGIECSHVQGSPWPPALLGTLDALCRDINSRRAITQDWYLAHRWGATPPGRKIDPTDFPDADLKAFIAGLYSDQGEPDFTSYERRYRVKYNRSVVRQGPSRSFAIVGYVDAGREFWADSLKFGEPIEGDDQWIHAASGVGFISNTAVERV